MSDFMMAIKGMKSEVKGELKEMISDFVTPMQNQITGIKESVENVETKLGETAAKVTVLEQKMQEMVLGGGSAGDESRNASSSF